MKKFNLSLVMLFFVSSMFCFEYNSILSVSKDATSVVSKDNTLYLASSNGISIYNFSEENLQLVNTVNLTVANQISSINCDDNYLFHSGVHKFFDITDNENPIELGLSPVLQLSEFHIVDNYVVGRSNGLYCFDINDLEASPNQLMENVNDIDIVDNRLFTLSYNSANSLVLEEYSMSLPSSISLVDSYILAENQVYAKMTLQNERIFVREKEYLYVLSYANGIELVETIGPLPQLDNDEYNILSVSNESLLISPDGYYWDISDVDNIIQFQDWRNGTIFFYMSGATLIGDYYLKPNFDTSFAIFDFNDLENVEKIYDQRIYYNAEIEIFDETLLDVSVPKLKMFDLNNPDNIVEIGTIENADWNTGFRSITTAQDKLLLTSDQDITILNTENGISQLEFCSTVGFGEVGQIVSYNDYLYHIGPESLQMQIIDISEAESPEILSSVSVEEISAPPVNLYVIDNFLLLVSPYRLVAIYDLGIPSQPQYLSSFSFNTLLDSQHYADEIKIAVQENIAYVSFLNRPLFSQSFLSDIFIFDITDIENWLLLNTITSNGGYSNDIEVVGDFLYSVSNHGENQINMYQLDGIGGFNLVASYTTDICFNSFYTDFDVFNNKLFLSRRNMLICYDIIYYTENDSYEIVPSNEISANNYPNPFNPETTISYELTNKGNVSVDIYNLKGQKVKTLFSESQDAGMHSLVWRGDNDAGKQVSSGTYLYRVKSGNDEIVKKMLMVK